MLLVSCGTPARPTPEPPPEEPPLDWAELEARASRATGLEWTTPAQHYEVTDAELDARIALETSILFDDELVVNFERELVALGFASPGFNLRETLHEVESNAVLGFYSMLDDRLYVAPENIELGDGTTPDGLAVHELVHALQARHSRLTETALGLLGQDDLAFALAAAMEGEALYVEEVDAKLVEGEDAGSVSLSKAEIDAEWDIEAYRHVFPTVPDILIDAWLLPYPLGLDLARRHASESGYGDRLRRDPPMSSEQLLSPGKWIDPTQQDAPVFLSLPDVVREGCSEFARNTLGVLGWRRFLSKYGTGGDDEAAQSMKVDDAVSGWGGDRYVLVDCGGRDQLGIAYVTDTEEDARELVPVLERSLRQLAAASSRLAKDLDMRAEGRRIQATLGFDSAERSRLWNETRQHRYENLDAFLAAHPEVFERAAMLRRRASQSGQEDHAGG